MIRTTTGGNVGQPDRVLPNPLVGHEAQRRLGQMRTDRTESEVDIDELARRMGCRDQVDLLREWGYRVDWHAYPMAHSVCDAEVADLQAWLLTQLA